MDGTSSLEKLREVACNSLFVAAARQDRPYIRETSEGFCHLLERRGIEHRWVLFAGGHGWRWWSPVLEQALAHALGA